MNVRISRMRRGLGWVGPWPWLGVAAALVLLGARAEEAEPDNTPPPVAAGAKEGAPEPDAGTPAAPETGPGDAEAPVTTAVGEAGNEVPPAGADGVPAVDPGNPYQAIVARNAFRLKEPVPPPPPPAPPPVVPEQPKLDVKLAGLAEIKGVRYAYFMVPDPDRQGQFLYPALTDDPKRGNNVHRAGLEVRQIDLEEQTVRLVNGGIEATLNFQENGVKNAPSAAPAKPGAIPAPPGQSAAGVVRTAVVPAPAAGSSAGSAGSTPSQPMVFSRNRSRTSGLEAPPPHDPTSAGLGVGSAQVSLVPSRPLRTSVLPNNPSTTVQPQTPQLLPQVSVEQQYEILLRQRQAADAQGVQLPPIPGVPLPTDPAAQ